MRGRYAKTKETDPFYSSGAWKAWRAEALKRDGYCCVWCRQAGRYARDRAGRLIPVPATMVHHKIPIEKDRSLALEFDNLVSLCDKCHDEAHPEKHAKAGQKVKDPIPEIAKGIRVERL